jgi:hypothetical protein
MFNYLANKSFEILIWKQGFNRMKMFIKEKVM